MYYVDMQLPISKAEILAKVIKRAAKLDIMTKYVQRGHLDSLIEELEHQGNIYYMSTFIDNTVHLMTSNGVSKTYESGLVGEKLTALYGEIIEQHQTVARCDWAIGDYIWTVLNGEFNLISDEKNLLKPSERWG